ncbi:Pentatricopeptide repeat (PPR-like) superfamily protein isoform 1 [Dorcoceras hygrometricum]|uniref:Pentatricopeptide repeat (PPR-like) superfamily protein isoform 1 n=1 Tax=Dorcoceras hygrometricum TaxID=472368 RepID=A0A2Z7C927_9LAMI|nr:Pentatricopeptide repeat (PPR-like) superfamily protein isoform 1 [Dorcoceras hygrometricum]
MFRGNSDACVIITVDLLRTKKIALLTSLHLSVYKGNRSAYVSIADRGLHSLHSQMASAFITYSYQINFESVLMIHDHEGMLNMFKALEDSGLRRFLGCESILYETELGHFFDTALIQDEDITYAITVKAGSFDSVTVERFQMMTAIQYGLKVNWGKVLFNVLKDMVDMSQKKAKGFAAQIGVLLKGIPAITMGDGVPFPSAKVLSMRTVHTYIVTNTTIDARTESEEPGMAKTPKAKKKPSSADEMPVDMFAEFTASKKRSATEADAPIIIKKRRTGKSKPSVSQENLDIVQVATDVEPIQIVDPTNAAATVPPLMLKRKSRKRRLVLSKDSDDESVGTEEIIQEANAAVVLSTVGAEIAKVLEETLALGVTATERESQGFDEARFEEDFARWLDDFVSRHNEPELVSTNNEAQATGSTNSVVDKEVNMPIDDLLIQISDDLLLPITTAEVTIIKLGAFSTSGDKGKGKLIEVEQVTASHAQKIFALICRDVEVIVQVRDSVMQAVVDFFGSFSLNNMPDIESLKDLKEKESPSQLGGRHSNPVVTTPTIALDFSGTTQQSASHNVAPNQAFLKSFEVQQLRVSTSSALQLLKWVANERAKQGEFSATKISKTKAECDGNLGKKCLDCKPNVVTFNTIIKSLFDSKYPLSEIMSWYEKMKITSVSPSSFTYSILIDGFCKKSNLEKALLMLEEMDENGFPPCPAAYCSLINSLCRAKRYDAAHELFQELKENCGSSSARVYAVMIKHFGKCGRLTEALDLFNEMKRLGCSPDVYAYNALMSGMVRSGMIDEAQLLLRTMEQNGCTPDLNSHNIILNGLAKTGGPQMAMEMLEKMKNSKLKPDAVSYNTVLGCLSRAGMFEEAANLMREMRSNGLQYDLITYSSILEAVGKVDEDGKLLAA